MRYIVCISVLGNLSFRTNSSTWLNITNENTLCPPRRDNWCPSFLPFWGLVKLKQELLEFSKVSCLVLSLVNLGTLGTDLLHSWKQKGRLTCHGNLWTRKHALRTYQVLIAGFPGPCVNWWANPCVFLKQFAYLVISPVSCGLLHLHFHPCLPHAFPVKLLHSHSTLTQTNAKFTEYSFATFGREMEGGGKKKRRRRKGAEGRKEAKEGCTQLLWASFCWSVTWGYGAKSIPCFLNAKIDEENYGSFFFFKGHVHTQKTSPPLWRVHGF